MTTSKALNSNYRPDIDGLRAIAIILVIIFHAFPAVLTAGFIGVDIFFVISGYLISGIVLKEIRDREDFSFLNFYYRRIKRIFPALIVVILSSLCFGWFFLLADEYKQLGLHAFGASGFLSNIVLWSESGYFDVAAENKPFLHLWSLAIEEQFYLIWPLFLFLSWKNRINTIGSILSITILSFLINIIVVDSSLSSAFYLPFSRIWELSAGALLAYFNFKSNILLEAQTQTTATDQDNLFKTYAPLISNLKSVIGLISLVIPLIIISSHSLFPGWLALLPVLASLLIISAGPKAWLNQKILSNPILVWVGLISYPLYLWHWPLLSFARILEGQDPAPWIIITTILISIGLAWLTFIFIEKPIRFGKVRKRIIALLCLFLFTLGSIGLGIYLYNGLPNRIAAKHVKANTHSPVSANISEKAQRQDIQAASLKKAASTPTVASSPVNDFDMPYRQSCVSLTRTQYSDDWCNAGNSPGKPPNIVMIGDSFSNAYAAMLNSLVNDLGTQFTFKQFGRGECPVLIDYGPAFCRELTTAVMLYLQQNKDIQTVILAGYWPAYEQGKYYKDQSFQETTASFMKQFSQTINYIKSLNKNIIVFYPPPTGANPRTCLDRGIYTADSKKCELTLAVAKSLDGEYRPYFDDYLIKKEKIPVFDPFKYLCHGQNCKVQHEGRILTVDGGHLSVYGAQYLAREAQAELNTLLLSTLSVAKNMPKSVSTTASSTTTDSSR